MIPRTRCIIPTADPGGHEAPAGIRAARAAIALAVLVALPTGAHGGEDGDAAEARGRVTRLITVVGSEPPENQAPRLSDPLSGTPAIRPEQTGQDADSVLARMLRPRSDTWDDWTAPLEPLHHCGEPRALPPCVPPPPCHPSMPPMPYDLVGVVGEPSCGPIYRGPCEPRTGTHDGRLHRLWDRLFDCFYAWK